MLNPVANAIVDAVKSAMADAFFYIFQKLLYLIDTIERAAKIFSGAEYVTYEGKQWSLINILIFGEGTVGRAIKYMTYIAVLFAFVFAFISLSRSIFDLETDNRRRCAELLSEGCHIISPGSGHVCGGISAQQPADSGDQPGDRPGRQRRDHSG